MENTFAYWDNLFWRNYFIFPKLSVTYWKKVTINCPMYSEHQKTVENKDDFINSSYDL